MLHVERQAFLGAVGPHEMRGETLHAVVVGAREIAHAGTLDLDHARTEVGELARAERRRDRVLERDDGDAFERTHGEPARTSAASPARAHRCTRGSGWSRSAPPGRAWSRGTCAR